MSLKIVADDLQSLPSLEEGDVLQETLTVSELLKAWEVAKTEELTANQRRLAVEQQLAALLPAPPEGQKTHKIEGWRVTRTNKVNYGGNLAQVVTLAEELELPCLTKTVLDETALKRLRKTHPTDFDLLVDAGAVTIKDAKPHFEVARVPAPELAQT